MMIGVCPDGVSGSAGMITYLGLSVLICDFKMMFGVCPDGVSRSTGVIPVCASRFSSKRLSLLLYFSNEQKCEQTRAQDSQGARNARERVVNERVK